MRFVLITATVLVVVVTAGVLLPGVRRWLLGLIARIGPPFRSSDGTSGRRDGLAACERCHAQFEYYLVHNGFNDSAYAYCDTCGRTALLSGWAGNIPAGVDLRIHQPITAEVEDHLAPCACGGRFRAQAVPRCPHCRHPLSATSLTKQIESNAPGTKAGWRWQQSWSGMYAIVIENRLTQDHWASTTPESNA